jgi:hypothetical protein
MPHCRFLLALALAACSAPPEADFTPTEAARTAPPPLLAPTSDFDAALAGAAPAAEQLEARTAALAARAAALRERAAALDAPVVSPEAAPRLKAATEGSAD